MGPLRLVAAALPPVDRRERHAEALGELGLGEVERAGWPGGRLELADFCLRPCTTFYMHIGNAHTRILRRNG